MVITSTSASLLSCSDDSFGLAVAMGPHAIIIKTRRATTSSASLSRKAGVNQVPLPTGPTWQQHPRRVGTFVDERIPDTATTLPFRLFADIDSLCKSRLSTCSSAFNSEARLIPSTRSKPSGTVQLDKHNNQMPNPGQ